MGERVLSSVQIMACRLFIAQILPVPMISYCNRANRLVVHAGSMVYFRRCQVITTYLNIGYPQLVPDFQLTRSDLTEKKRNDDSGATNGHKDIDF